MYFGSNLQYRLEPGVPRTCTTVVWCSTRLVGTPWHPLSASDTPQATYTATCQCRAAGSLCGTVQNRTPTLQSLPTSLRNFSEPTSRLACGPQDCISRSVRLSARITTCGLLDLKHLRMRLITSYTLARSGAEKRALRELRRDPKVRLRLTSEAGKNAGTAYSTALEQSFV